MVFLAYFVFEIVDIVYFLHISLQNGFVIITYRCTGLSRHPRLLLWLSVLETCIRVDCMTETPYRIERMFFVALLS